MPDRFTDILAVHDGAVGSDHALAQAIVVARATGARLTVAQPLGVGPTSPAAIEEARKFLARILPSIAQEGVAASADVLVGTPYVEITRRVLRDGHDLVVVGSETGRGIKDVLVGSTATNLLRKCPCAVWVVKPRRGARSDAVLAAVDAPGDGAAEALSAKVLDFAALLARARSAPLHVVHSWDVEGKEADTLRSEIPDHTRRDILRRHERVHRDAVEAMLARRHDALQARTHLPRGVPERAVVDLAEQQEVGVVVMGTDGHAGLSGLLLGLLPGHAVEQVLSSVRCDVLAVKPDAFRSSIAAPEDRAAADPRGLDDGRADRPSAPHGALRTE